MPEWASNDELFFRELREGKNWEHYTAHFLRLRGIDASVGGLSVRRDISEAHRWLGSVDIVAGGFPIEVKWRNVRFCSPGDYPFPTAMVDTVSGFDAKKPKPVAYIIGSKPTGAMLWLPTSSRAEWETISRIDRVRHIEDDFYAAPRRLFRDLESLVDRIRELAGAANA